MKFIRKGGRIIPIKESSEQKINSAKKYVAASSAVATYSLLRAKTPVGLGFGLAASLGLSAIAGKKAGIGDTKDRSKKKAISNKLSAASWTGVAIGTGVAIAPIISHLAKFTLVNNRYGLKKAANKVGDTILSMRSAVLNKPLKKTVDLSKGAKFFKAKSKAVNPLAGLLK